MDLVAISAWAAVAAAVLTATGIFISIWRTPPEGFKFEPERTFSSNGTNSLTVHFSLMGGTIAYHPLVNIVGPVEYQIYGQPEKMTAETEPIHVLLDPDTPESFYARVEVRWVASTRRRPLTKGARFCFPEMEMQQWKRSKLLPWRHHWATISQKPKPYPRPLPGEKRPKV